MVIPRSDTARLSTEWEVECLENKVQESTKWYEHMIRYVGNDI